MPPRIIEDRGEAARSVLPLRRFTSPHWPLHAFESDIERYKGRYREGWDALRAERHQRMIRMGLVDKTLGPHAARRRGSRLERRAGPSEWQQRRMEVYAAQIDRMDQNVGRILEALRQTGKEQDTLILFLADNGGCAEDLPAGRLRHTTAPSRRATDARALR